jgi:hypothetical protein
MIVHGTHPMASSDDGTSAKDFKKLSWKCDYCDLRYRRKDDLQYHIEHKHSDEFMADDAAPTTKDNQSIDTVEIPEPVDGLFLESTFIGC